MNALSCNEGIATIGECIKHTILMRHQNNEFMECLLTVGSPLKRVLLVSITECRKSLGVGWRGSGILYQGTDTVKN